MKNEGVTLRRKGTGIVKKTEHRKGSFYWKSLVLVLAITCLPALLIGIGIYNLGAEPIVQELNKAHQEQLNQSIR